MLARALGPRVWFIGMHVNCQPHSMATRSPFLEPSHHAMLSGVGNVRTKVSPIVAMICFIMETLFQHCQQPEQAEQSLS